MKLIRPKHINNDYLLSSNVTEADYSAYNAVTTYALGDKVIVVSPSATVTIAIASPCVITWTAHGLVDDTVIIFTTTGALPTGITAGQHYYVRVLTPDTFNISETKLNFRELTTSGTQSGTHTGTASMHNIYESLQSSNVGNTPRLSSTWWLDLGATNRWKMFDLSVSSRTTNADSISISLQPTGRCDSVALLNISAATSRFRMTDSGSSATITMTIASPCVITDTGHSKVNGDMVRFSTTGTLPTGIIADTTYYVVNKVYNTYELSETLDGISKNTSGSQSGTHTVRTVVYDSTYSLTYTDGIDNWYSYFFEPILRKRDNVEIDMPRYSDPIIDITLTGTGELVACGACIIGTRFDIGGTQYGARSGIDNYSIKTRDNFGNYNILERAFSKRADFTSWVNNGRIGAVQDILSDYRATPIVYIGEEGFSNTIIYGFYKDFSIDITYPTVSICTTTIEGLT